MNIIIHPWWDESLYMSVKGVPDIEIIYWCNCNVILLVVTREDVDLSGWQPQEKTTSGARKQDYLGVNLKIY